MNNFIHEENGFTLVEVLLTICLFSILSISILKLFSIGNQRLKKNLEISSAMIMAQGTFEQIKAEKKIKGFDSLHESQFNRRKNGQKGLQQTVCIDKFEVDLKKIVVIVKWSGGSDSLVSIIGKY